MKQQMIIFIKKAIGRLRLKLSTAACIYSLNYFVSNISFSLIFGGNFMALSSALPKYPESKHFINLFVMMNMLTILSPIAVGSFFIMITALVDKMNEKIW